MKRNLFLPLITVALCAGCSDGTWKETQTEFGYNLITQEGGKTLGYNPESGVTIMTVDGYAFKDMNRNGELDPYEDWRLSAEERAADLSSRLPIEEIAGMMLYSSHQVQRLRIFRTLRRHF